MADNQASEVREKVDYDDPTERRGDILAAIKAAEGVKQAEIPASKPVEAKPESASAQTETTPAPSSEGSESPPAAEAEPTEEAAEPPAPDTLAAPSNWSKADKERFAELPKAAQEIVVERHKAMEADYTRKTMEIAELKREYAPVDEMFSPYKAQLRHAGFTPASAIQSWMAAEQALMNPNTREDAIRGLAQAYGLDLAKIAGVSAQAPQAQLDPSQMTEQQQIDAMLQPILASKFAPYEQKISALEADLRRATQFQQGMAQTETQRVQQSIMTEVQNFAGAKDTSGNLLHPYFSDVEQTMAALLAGYHHMKLPAPPLGQLYEEAVRANPSTYERLVAQQKAATETARLTEARAKAAKASRAGSSVSGSPNGGQTFAHANGADREMSIRESLMAAVEATRQ